MMRFIVVAVLCLVGPAATSHAEQRHAAAATQPAGICDGYDGLPFAFCVAICEARECHHRPTYDQRCATLRSGFDRVTGGQSAPCEGGPSAGVSMERL